MPLQLRSLAAAVRCRWWFYRCQSPHDGRDVINDLKSRWMRNAGGSGVKRCRITLISGGILSDGVERLTGCLRWRNGDREVTRTVCHPPPRMVLPLRIITVLPASVVPLTSVPLGSTLVTVGVAGGSVSTINVSGLSAASELPAASTAPNVSV